MKASGPKRAERLEAIRAQLEVGDDAGALLLVTPTQKLRPGLVTGDRDGEAAVRILEEIAVQVEVPRQVRCVGVSTGRPERIADATCVRRGTEFLHKSRQNVPQPQSLVPVAVECPAEIEKCCFVGARHGAEASRAANRMRRPGR